MSPASRTELLIGGENVGRLERAHVLIVGVGGVGGCVFELLVRAGIGHITVVDGDCIEESNLNRQMLATLSTLNMPKVEAAAKRAADISSTTVVTPLFMRYNPQTSCEILGASYDYCIDCFDSVKDKIHFIAAVKRKGLKLISAMGAGNRLSMRAEIADVFSTKNDGLARAVRKGLKAEGVTELKTAFSSVPPLEISGTTVASISYAPVGMGCVIAEEVIKDLICL